MQPSAIDVELHSRSAGRSTVFFKQVRCRTSGCRVIELSRVNKVVVRLCPWVTWGGKISYPSLPFSSFLPFISSSSHSPVGVFAEASYRALVSETAPGGFSRDRYIQARITLVENCYTSVRLSDQPIKSIYLSISLFTYWLTYPFCHLCICVFYFFIIYRDFVHKAYTLR